MQTRNLTSEASDLKVMYYKGVLHTYTCCLGSMCNQRACTHPALACGKYYILTLLDVC
jgi:hypothetical protein